MSTNPTITRPNSGTPAGPCCLAAVAEFEAAARTLCSMSANANEPTRDAVYAAYLSLELPEIMDTHDGVFIAAALAKAVTAVLTQDDTRGPA